MLDFPIVDSHLHIWDLNRLRYPWLDQIPELNKTCLMKEFDAARGPYAVDKIVFMQAECSHGQYMDEVQFVEEVAREDARLKAIVAWAPMEVEGENLRALEQLAGRPLVKGIRRLIQTENSESFCRIPALTQALRRLPELGLTFDLGIHTGQFYDVVRRPVRRRGLWWIIWASRTFAGAGWRNGRTRCAPFANAKTSGARFPAWPRRRITTTGRWRKCGRMRNGPSNASASGG